MADAAEHKQPRAVGFLAPSSQAAYPYANLPPYYAPAPPPRPSSQGFYDPYYGNPPNDVCPARRLLRLVITACIVLFVVTGVITVFFWLILRPRVPTFAVSSASVANFNVSSASNGSGSYGFLSGDFNFSFDVGNPNTKMSVEYDKVEAAVGYRREAIAVVALPPFGQEKRSDTVLRASFAARDQYVRADSADAILKEKSGNGGVVRFRLRVLARVHFGYRGWRTRTRSMRIKCDRIGIKFGNSTSGSLLGSASKCRVAL